MKFAKVALVFLGLMSVDAIQIKNAVELEAEKPPCVYLDETQAELDYQVDRFSRTLDPRHWTNVVNLRNALSKKTGSTPKLQVHSWELLDKAFSFPRVRRYQYVQEN